MLKKRIIPLLLWQNGRLVKTVSFGSPTVVGEPIRTCKSYSDQDADELILLNIDKNPELWQRFLSDVMKISSGTMMPLTVGGGVNSLDRAAELFDAGADKVAINSVAYETPAVIEAISGRYGSQSLVLGVDFASLGAKVLLLSNSGTNRENVSLSEHIKRIEGAGAGEILAQSVTRDGTKTGLDLNVLSELLETTSVPLVIGGGVGNFLHLRDALLMGASGVACGTIFNFGDNNPFRAKAYLRNHNIPLKGV